MTSPVEDAGLVEVARLLESRGAPPFDMYKEKCLRRRLAVRMRACGVHTLGEYADVLRRHDAEVQRLLDALTINVTQFFRNPETWERLRALVPALLAQRDGAVRAWSAGCSSGEEPYSLAMLLADAATAAGRPDWIGRFSIDATDIDAASLDRAREGRYPVHAAGVPALPEAVGRWSEVHEGVREIAESLRQRVRVTRLDLGRDLAPPAPPYDLVLCRNVVIYFGRPVQERLFDGFAAALAPGGLLVLGKVETLLGPARDRLQVVDQRERIYRRVA